MTTSDSSLAKRVSQFCANLGKDRLVVQGGGGNVSWKDKDKLWIKESGAHIGDALQKNIFVALDLNLMRQAIRLCNYGEPPIVLSNIKKRASIESMVHALFPQRFVVHLHDVNVLSRLVLNDANVVCTRLAPIGYKFVFVEYHMPGAHLARAISALSEDLGQIDFVFLKNHGIIVLDNDINQLSKKLEIFQRAFYCSPRDLPSFRVPLAEEIPNILSNVFRWVDELDIHALAVDKFAMTCVASHWVMYPDHAVFLGGDALIVDIEEIDRFFDQEELNYPFIFVRDRGVLINKNTNTAQLHQLLCYSDIIRRLDIDAELTSLSVNDIAALLKWDAEIYRKKVSACHV